MDNADQQAGGLSILPNSIIDIPFRIDVPNALAHSLPPSVEVRDGATQYEIRVDVRATNESQLRVLRIRYPRFDPTDVLLLAKDEIICHEVCKQTVKVWMFLHD